MSNKFIHRSNNRNLNNNGNNLILNWKQEAANRSSSQQQQQLIWKVKENQMHVMITECDKIENWDIGNMDIENGYIEFNIKNGLF